MRCDLPGLRVDRRVSRHLTCCSQVTLDIHNDSRQQHSLIDNTVCTCRHHTFAIVAEQAWIPVSRPTPSTPSDRTYRTLLRGLHGPYSPDRDKGGPYFTGLGLWWSCSSCGGCLDSRSRSSLCYIWTLVMGHGLQVTCTSRCALFRWTISSALPSGSHVREPSTYPQVSVPQASSRTRSWFLHTSLDKFPADRKVSKESHRTPPTKTHLTML